jgi:site-specific recombinase XerD
MLKGEYSRKVIIRTYTHQEISKIIQVSNLRMKVIILLMASTGIPVGALPSLKMRNLEKINDIHKVTVYKVQKNRIFTFTTPERTHSSKIVANS